MSARTRARLDPTDDWSQLQIGFEWPEQVSYELIRPVVLFGCTPAERAQQTGVSPRTIYRKIGRFDARGMRGLFEAEEDPESKRLLPTTIRGALAQLKIEYPAFRPNELATVCSIRFNRRPGVRTIKRVLAEEPTPASVTRRFPPYAEIADPIERRAAVVRLHAEGWNIASIAGYLQTSRPTIYATLKRWVEEGVRGLADKPPLPKHPARKADLAAMHTIRQLQVNPELGEFRIHAALKQLGVHLSPRTCGRILALNRKLYGLHGPTTEPREPKAMPFKATRRHQYWTVDLRYLDHQLDDGNVYVISILENYSRAILASALSRSQDLSAFLMVLYAAIRQHGAPEALVSDSGSIFLAKQARAIYRALGITKEQIARRQSWQSYIETAFNIQRRMADWHFSQASTWSELLDAHDRWVADYNYQVHWAHRERQDGRQSPADVLGWVTGTAYSPERLHRIFYATRFGRRVDQVGYVRFRHWRLYGERGLAGQPAALWLYGATLTLQFAQEPLAQYAVTYASDAKHFHALTNIRLFETRFRSPQLELWELGAENWHLVLRLPEPARRRPATTETVQASLFPVEPQAAVGR
jgi:putative transposase